MTTAVDTSVLIAITKGERDADRWVDLLADARRDGDLVIRDVVVPDFLIGAHAIEQADRIAAVDRGSLRRYFPKLEVLRP